ncbi:MAG: hypothetical protein V4467_02580 [Patescibacteria group bacterium]
MLSLNFDTRNNNTVYIAQRTTTLKTVVCAVILTFISIVCLILFCLLVVLSAAFGGWLGGLMNETLRGILALLFILPAVYYGFIGSVVVIAYVGFLIRSKILNTYGYFRNGYFSKDNNRILECCKLDGSLITSIDLNTYSILESKKDVGSENVELYLVANDGKKISLASIFTQDFNNFDPWTGAPGESAAKSYPTDEMFVLWNNIELKKDGRVIPLSEYRVQQMSF